PVCYNRGGSKPTVTDANVVLGRLNPDHFLNGEMEIYPDRAYRVIKEKIAEPLNMNVYKAAEGIITVVNANMQRGIRKVSVERGYDPRQFCLFSFGGAGPVHGAQLAEQLNMPKVIVPANPGIASAIGMLTADVRHDYVQTYLSEAGDTKAGVILTVFRSLEAEAVSQLRQEGFSKANIILERKVDLRYKGQAYELSVPVNCGNISQLDISNIRLEFDRKHSRIYGFERKEKEVEFVNIRVVALGKLPVLPSQHKECYHELNPRATEIRKVFFNGEFYNTPVYRREKFKYGNQIKGPAVIEQLDSTTVIFPGQVAETDFYDNIIINSIIRVKS
ncbi:MAG: hydantoinase/oxoprolinase family protein, partial [Victivallales bacterium]|nr:hydantoinase/oxoprolinase family protein [Victivallales bacterium]